MPGNSCLLALKRDVKKPAYLNQYKSANEFQLEEPRGDCKLGSLTHGKPSSSEVINTPQRKPALGGLQQDQPDDGSNYAAKYGQKLNDGRLIRRVSRDLHIQRVIRMCETRLRCRSRVRTWVRFGHDFESVEIESRGMETSIDVFGARRGIFYRGEISLVCIP